MWRRCSYTRQPSLTPRHSGATCVYTDRPFSLGMVPRLRLQKLSLTVSAVMVVDVINHDRCYTSSLDSQCLDKYLRDATGSKGTKQLSKWEARGEMKQDPLPAKVCKLSYIVLRLLQNARYMYNHCSVSALPIGQFGINVTKSSGARNRRRYYIPSTAV